MGKAIGQRPVRDISETEEHKLSRDEVAALRESLGKCVDPATGEPVSARKDDTAVLPVSGSVTGSEDGNGRGTCPHCGAHVRLSGKGYVTSHSVRTAPLPAPDKAVRLVERAAEVTDTGARVGSPDAAMRDRDAEIRTASGTATVKIRARVSGPDGKERTETVEVPATADNIRTALRQEQAKRQRPEYFKDPATGQRVKTGRMGGGPDASKLHKLGAMLRAATGSQAAPVLGAEPGTYKVYEAVTLDAPNAPEGREERTRVDGTNGHVATSPGPALVNGRPMSGAIPEESDRVTAKGKPRNAIGWSGSLGRVRPDAGAIEGNREACGGKRCELPNCVGIVGGDRYGYIECHVFRTMSKTQRRRYWDTVKANEQRATDAARRARRVVDMPGRQWPVSSRSMSVAAIVQQQRS